MPRGGSFAKKVFDATIGSNTAKKVANTKVGKSIGAHPYRYGAGAAVGMGAMASGRRRSGLDRPQGRPTGMRNY